MSGEPARWVRKRFTPAIRRPAITMSNLILYGARRHDSNVRPLPSEGRLVDSVGLPSLFAECL
jgi:hypothetical protein